MFDAIQNELQYRFGTKGALKGNVQKDETGTYSPNLLQSALGVTSEQLTNAANQGQRNRFNDTEMGQEAASYGIDLGTGAPNLSSIRKGLSDAKTRETLGQKIKMLGGKPGDVTDIGVLAEMADTLGTDRNNNKLTNSPEWIRQENRYNDTKAKELKAFELARADINFNREDAQNQRMFARRESSLDRAQTQDLAILSQGHQMKLAQMNQDLANKRMGYDRETKRMDRRDAMIAQLLSGLGQLGGAF